MFFRRCLTVFSLITITCVKVNCNDTDVRELQEQQIERWAKKIGDDLWKLGEVTTKFKEIQGSYNFSNAKVEEKNITELILQVRKDIERMMDRKCDAIKCISERAESAAENQEYNPLDYKYYSSKESNVSKVSATNVSTENETISMYNTMKLNADTHFYNLEVDTDRSSVHVPTNIFDKHVDPAFAIQWSEQLNEVFVQNYNSDPALSWQYFGSSTGIMRHYPAKKWHETKKDLFDCRVRTWYIEAATCTKDVIILVDNTGSMDGMGRHIASLTVNTILDTFSNNDYINVLYYSNETTNYTIPCFKDRLVQATPENVMLFKDIINDKKQIVPSGKTDLPQALNIAFDILENIREIRNCNVGSNENETSKACNQAIMLITDGIARNLSEIVLARNNFNGTKPVRIFTYLIGRESTNVEEIRWMACANRGFYAHVQTLEQVQTSVLQYINVIARPLVLQNDHPISWTHAYIDMTYNDTKDDQINVAYRLLTSAAVPAFDKKSNNNTRTRMAKLLGVAGTDVPIDDIEKLTLPYKLGVNAYAFIISNNGYVLMHRDFRPMVRVSDNSEKKLRKNYNSIDLVEVEQFNQDLPPRDFPPDLISLRNSIVNGSQGEKINVSIKYHYDNMQRVTTNDYNFYYVPLSQTPFSLAFAVPNHYGSFSLQVKDDIKNDRNKPGVKIIDYFNDSNWKIHPKWVYCKYHYIEGHEYETPEKELTDFLDKVNDDDFVWKKQYEADEAEELEKVDCGLNKTHDNNDYYCDEHLVQRLVFDAKNTQAAFRSTSWKDTDLWFKAYNATLRFVATMSGLTRWEYISEEVENNTNKKFGNLHSRAIDETWYKSAVIQHYNDPESFVYSVPFPESKVRNEDLLITGSYAVFLTDGNKTAPGCVVGFQFAHKNFVKIVLNLTENLSNECKNCLICQLNLTCYIIDGDGYIIVSENLEDTGTFFGKVQTYIMELMVVEKIFEKVTIYDYQAICESINDKGSASILFTPVDYLKIFINWCIMKISWLTLEINLYSLWSPFYTYAEEKEKEEEEKAEEEEQYYNCEKYRHLYMLNYTILKNTSNTIIRPYFIKKIPHSNLLFVAINDTMLKSQKITVRHKHSTDPEIIEYNNSVSYPCKKLELNNFPRRRLAGCYNEHPLESEIKICGASTTIELSYIITVLCLLSKHLY